MANITIRNLDGDVDTRLHVRAAEHHRSLEEEVRIILRDAVTGRSSGPRNLTTFTRQYVASLGGVELELPPRGPSLRGDRCRAPSRGPTNRRGRLPDRPHFPLARSRSGHG